MKRAKKVIVALFIGLAFLLTQGNISSASMGGTSAEGDEKVVGLIDYHTGQAGCSGALIAPRMVFTAGHCLAKLDPQLTSTPAPDKKTYPNGVEINELWIAKPGVALPIGANVTQSKVIAAFRSPKYQPSTSTTPPQYDFAVLVLADSLGSKTFKWASFDQIQNFKKNETPGIAMGYGLISWADYKEASAGGGRQPLPHQLDVKFTNDFLPTDDKAAVDSLLYIRTVAKPGTNICGGDSGGPLWVQQSGEWIYVGPTSGANGPTCVTPPTSPLWEDPYWKFHTGTTTWTAQAFPDVINDAQNYLKSLEVVAKPISTPKPKVTTITCFKGKTSKKVTAVNPKCPFGYKKK